jgi:hypothetical protein
MDVKIDEAESYATVSVRTAGKSKAGAAVRLYNMKYLELEVV